MRKLWLSLLVLVAPLLYATQFAYSSSSLNATAASATTAFTNNAGVGRGAEVFKAYNILVCNTGTTNEVFVTALNTTATTADYRIDPAASATAPNCISIVWSKETGTDGFPSISYICSATETTTIKVWAER